METWYYNEIMQVNYYPRKSSKVKLKPHRKHLVSKQEVFKRNHHMNKTNSNACKHSTQSKFKLAIAAINFPQEKLSTALTELLYNILEEKSKQSENKKYRNHLLQSTFVHSCLVFHNANKPLTKWLEAAILECNNNEKWLKLCGPKLCLTSYDKVKLIQVKAMISAKGSIADIEHRLQVQNKELDSRNWTFLSWKEHTVGMKQCVFAITSNSLMKLKKSGFILYFGLGKVYASI